MSGLIDVPEREYLADRGSLSGSVLDKVAKDPRLFEDWLRGRPEPDPNDEMRLGTYVHALALLGPEEANRTIAIAPNRHMAYRALTKAEERKIEKGEKVERRKQDPSPEGEFLTMEKRGEENHALWDRFVASAKGRTIIKPEQVPMATAMVKALYAHEKAGALLEAPGFRPERAMYWACQYTGEPLRGKLDGANEAADEITEIKTTWAVNPEADVMTWVRAGWARKAALYIDGYRALTGRYPVMWWVFVEQSTTPRVVTRWVDTESPFVHAGRHGLKDRDGAILVPGYIDLIKRAQYMRDTGDFSHPWERQHEAQIVLPGWALSAMENAPEQGEERAA